MLVSFEFSWNIKLKVLATAVSILFHRDRVWSPLHRSHSSVGHSGSTCLRFPAFTYVSTTSRSEIQGRPPRRNGDTMMISERVLLLPRASRTRLSIMLGSWCSNEVGLPTLGWRPAFAGCEAAAARAPVGLKPRPAARSGCRSRGSDLGGLVLKAIFTDLFFLRQPDAAVLNCVSTRS